MVNQIKNMIKIIRKLLVLFFLIGLLLGSSFAQTIETNAVTSSFIGKTRNDFTGLLGFKFTTSSNSLTINSLGRYNHILNASTHTIKIVDVKSNIDIANVTINNLNQPINNYVYIKLPTPVTLIASNSYYLVSSETDGGDFWATDNYGTLNTLITTTSDIINNGAMLNNGSWVLRIGANATFEPLNFKYNLPNQIVNLPPKVSITSPTNNSSYTLPLNLNILANATDNDGTVVLSQLFINDVLVNKSTNLPINFNISITNAGSYKLNIKAIDNSGNQTLSSPIIFSVSVPVVSTIQGIFVSPNGSISASGDINNPLDLQTALNKTSILNNIINLRGGIYAHAPQGTSVLLADPGYNFVSLLSGTPSSPILVRSYPGENAIIDGNAYPFVHACTRPTIKIIGSNVWFQGLEFTSLSTEPRVSTSDSSFPDDITRSDGPYVFGQGIKFINCIFDNLTTGFSVWSAAGDFEGYGNLSFNNGWQGNPHPHGHNLYTQNYETSNPKILAFNFFINAFQNNVQAYGSSQAAISHYRFLNNTSVNRNFLIGGRTDCHLSDIQVLNNYFYNSDLELIYSLGTNYLDVIARFNYMVDGMLQIGAWQNASINNNTLITTKGATLIDIVPFTTLKPLPLWNWSGNSYNVFDRANPSSINVKNFAIEGEGWYGFGGWKTRSGYDNNSTYNSVLPVLNNIILTKNKYDSNKAFVIIYNWEQKTNIDLNVSNLGWTNGAKYELRSIQDYFSDIGMGTIQNQSININMGAGNHSIALPRGYSQALGSNSFPYFGAFILLNKG